MKYLVDTHLLLWASSEPERLPKIHHQIIANPDNELYFSVVNLWEIAIKTSLGRKDFCIDVSIFRKALKENGYQELVISGEHILLLTTLPQIHKDPFDRILVAQAISAGMYFLTADEVIAQYPGPIKYAFSK